MKSLYVALCVGSCAGFTSPLRAQPKESRLRLQVSQIPRDIQKTFDQDDPESLLDTFHVHDLLLQRAIQTQLYHFSQMQNEVTANWLSGFMNHSHLDSGEWHCVFGLNAPMNEYLQNLLQEPPHTVEVKVRARNTDAMVTLAAFGGFEDVPTLPNNPGSDAGTKSARSVPVAEVKEAIPESAAAAETITLTAAQLAAYGQPSVRQLTDSVPTQVTTVTLTAAQLAAYGQPAARKITESVPTQITDSVPTQVATEPQPVSEKKTDESKRAMFARWLARDGDSASSPDVKRASDALPFQPSAAAASRRRNPFLNQELKYTTHTQEINPQFLANSLMTITSQLGAEWREDISLQISSDDPAYRQSEIDERRKALKEKQTGDLSRLPVFESAERGRDGSSPLRRQNFDILQRVVTILAVKSLKFELAYESRNSVTARRSLQWVEKFCVDWMPGVSGVVKSKLYAGVVNSMGGKPSICEAMLAEMELQAPVFFADAMIDPTSLANRIRGHRMRVSERLVKALEDTDNIILDVQRQSLERAMLESTFR